MASQAVGFGESVGGFYDLLRFHSVMSVKRVMAMEQASVPVVMNVRPFALGEPGMPVIWICCAVRKVATTITAQA